MLKMAIYKDGTVRAISSYVDEENGGKNSFKIRKTLANRTEAINWHNSLIRNARGVAPSAESRKK